MATKTGIEGVGYDSGGLHKSSVCGAETLAYSRWRNIIKRCYNQKKLRSGKSYIGCTVSDEWLDFQNFAEWFYAQKNHDKNYHIDKDLLQKGNKVYSAENCCLIPLELNNLISGSGVKNGIYPQGVSFCKRMQRIRVVLSINNKSKTIGYFDSVECASNAHTSAKERYVKNKALEWANRVDWNVFIALMNWRVAA